MRNAVPPASAGNTVIQAGHSHLDYRADIDGLRAVAILPVVLYHAFPGMLPGGFVGVDVFFVISGFLISGIVWNALAVGDFSFARFYANRILRIFPALLTVLFTLYVAGWWLLMPVEFAHMGKLIAGGVGFSNNFLLWLEAGYFDKASTLKPLMHLWSLGIEEQFYLAFPLLIVILWRLKLSALPALIGLALVSFVLSIYQVGISPESAFFLPQYRVWELLAGTLLSWQYRQGSCKGTTLLPTPRLADAASLLGLALLLCAFFLINAESKFPGWWAVLPVAGASLLIAAGKEASVNRLLLASQPAIFIGLISYPLYLWHWPLFSLDMILNRQFVTDPTLQRGLLVAASLIASVGTYYLIERPIRFGGRRRMKVAGLCLFGLLIAYVGFNTYSRQGLLFRTGWVFRYPEIVRPLITYRFDDDKYFRSGKCHLRVHQGAEGFDDSCLRTDKGREKAILLWGDSHAAQFYPGLVTVFPDIDLLQQTAPGCQPILDWDVPGFPACRAVNQHIFAMIEKLRPGRVILSSRWLGIDQEEKIIATIRKIKDAGVREVIVIGPVPRWQPNLPEALTAKFRHQAFAVFPERLSEGLDVDKPVIDRRLAGLATQAGARYISPLNLLCNEAGCLVRPAGDDFGDAVMAIDDSHLSPEGSRYLMRLIRNANLL